MIGIYKITNKINNKVYIGQSGRIQNRLSAHKQAIFNENNGRYNDGLYEDIRKYGEENFSFEILETIKLNELEEKWIKIYEKTHDLYNLQRRPHTDPYSSIKIFSNEEIDIIIEKLKENKLSNIKIAKMFKCSPTTIDYINNGERYKIEGEKYPIRKFRMTGEKNPNAKYSDEEIMTIRKEYVNHTISYLYKKYGTKTNSLKGFEKIVNGKSYSHLPIYIKRKKEWITKDRMEYRLEP